MNSLRPANIFMKCRSLPAFLGILIVSTASATVPLYQNNDVLNYSIPGNPPPQIDAKGFDNESSFTINYNTYSPGTPYYQTANTLFYTNTGLLIANSPQTNTFNSLFFNFGYQTFGCGYKFDYYDGIQDYWADTFYNPGTIRCVSTQDGNGLLSVLTFFGGALQPQLSQLTSLGKVTVSATNIVNPGTLDVSVNGYINLAGNNVDLTGSQLTVEPPLNALGFNSISIASIGAIGVNTNIPWDPGIDLTATTAQSSYVPIPPFSFSFLSLTNSQSYLDVRQSGTNLNVYRYVFVENNSPDVQYKVYIDNPNTVSLGFAAGAAHVEWIGNVTDPASGNSAASYLYLTDDYALGASTNNFLVNGVPVNFTFLTSTTELLSNPQTVNFTALPDAFITNNYAAFSGNLVASTASTNISSSNPHGTITNLPGQIYISASNELNLAFANISGPNYLNLNCTNQFDGSPGAAIAAPYSDIALGVTNGTLVVSNVLMANLPNWSGTIQAFSSDWFEFDPVAGVTNEYKVMIVFSQLEPTGVPWTQNLYLHGTNQLVISDHLNVYGSLYADAKTLVLNTNQLGAGATSLDGELNWINTSPFYANTGSGVQQMPNLLWVTNNGLIRFANTATFGSPTNIFGAFVNNSLIADQRTTIWTTNFLNSGTITNGVGLFLLQSQTALLTNGAIYAGSDITLNSSNSLVISNHLLSASRKLTLSSAGLITDTGVTNGNIWVIGTNAAGSAGGGTLDSGFNVLVKPALGDLLGTTVTNYSPYNKTIYNVFATTNLGISTAGFSNNVAVGRLILDSAGPTGKPAFVFSGVGTNNALYVDELVLEDQMTNGINNSFDFSPMLTISNNMMIYFAQAVVGGVSIASKIDDASKIGKNNGGRLRWVPQYSGYYSSTNLVYPDGTTNAINTALASSTTIDSDGDGIANAYDATPFFVPSELQFRLSLTNQPQKKMTISWHSIPSATNYVFYRTNLLKGSWLTLTNFVSPSTVPPVGGWPITNVIYDAMTNQARFYQMRVDPAN